MSLPGYSVFHAFHAAILSLMGSAVLLIAGFILYQVPNLGASTVEPLVFRGSTLRLLIGRGNWEGDALVVRALDQRGDGVIVGSRHLITAADFPFLHYVIAGRNPRLAVVFYWVRRDQPRKTYFAPLPWKGDQPMIYRLEKQEEWRGEILEFGISLQGDLRGQSLIIQELTLQPPTIEALLKSVWAEWTAFTGWQPYSINTVFGTARQSLISPVLAAVAWIGLAVILLLTWWFFIGKRGSAKTQQNTPTLGFTFAIAFLFVWLLLDANWQWKLWQQHKETWHLFAGKSHREQHLAAEDAALYRYAEQLNASVPQKHSGRLFIIQNKWQSYQRLKIQYYLLPYNSYNYGNHPSRFLQGGDLLLALNPLNNLYYDFIAQRLHWGKNRAVRATLLHRAPLGSFYQVHENRFLLQQVSIHHGGRRLDTQGRILNNPLIFSGIPTQVGPDPGVVAIYRDQKGNLRIRFQEWDYRDDLHATESIAVLLAKPGRYVMKDGSIWEIGLLRTRESNRWQEGEFRQPFSSPPHLFLMPQQSLPDLALVPRAKEIDARGFRYRLDSQESKGTVAIDLPLAYLAVQAPRSWGWIAIDGRMIPYQIMRQSIDTQWNTIHSFQVRLQEEQSRDPETQHVPEQVDLLILGRDALFGQIVSAAEEDTVSLRRLPRKQP